MSLPTEYLATELSAAADVVADYNDDLTNKIVVTKSQRYKCLAKLLHPDKNPHPLAKEAF